MSKIAREINDALSSTKIWKRSEWKTPGKPVKVVWKYVRGVPASEAAQWLAIFQKDEPHETITYYFKRQADLTRAPMGRAGTGPVERRQAQAERMRFSLPRNRFRVLATVVADVAAAVRLRVGV